MRCKPRFCAAPLIANVLPRIGGIFIRGDNATSEGRSSERNRRILLTTFASAFARITGIVTTLVSVPLLINYLGTERYGLWMTINSVTYLLAFADFGLGNGLLNALSDANGRGDGKMAETYISSGLFILIGVALFLAASFVITYPWISWGKFFNVSSYQATAESGRSMAAFFICFLINIPTGVIQRVRYGYQEGYIDNLWVGAGRVLALLAIPVGVKLNVGLPWLIAIVAGTPILASLMNGVLLFYFKYPWLRPKWSAIDKRAMKSILNSGSLFFVWQLVYVLWYSSDNIIISRTLGPEYVSQFSISMRLFEMIPAVSMMVTYALWPAYSEAIAKGDIAWIEKTLKKAVKGGVLFSLCASLPLIILGQEIISLWAGPKIKPSPLLLIGAGLWSVMFTIGNIASTFLNGAKSILFQTVTMGVMTLVSIGLKVYLVKNIGVAGVIWANVFCFGSLVLIPTGIYIPNLLEKLKIKALVDANI